MSDQDNDLLLDLDDESEDSVDDSQERINKFLDRVEKMKKVLLARKRFDSEKRAKAARWLGESGEVTAIEALQKVYLRDNDPQVKKAAEYALGQFKALSIALDDPDLRPDAEQMLNDIVMEGAFGQPASPKPRTLQMAIGGLAVSFVLLMALGVVLGGMNSGGDGDPLPTAIAVGVPDSSDVNVAVATNPNEVGAQVLSAYQTLDSDANTLRLELLQITRGEAVNCDATLSAGGAYTPPTGIDLSTSPNITEAITTLNNGEAMLEPIRTSFITACNTATVISSEAAISQVETIIEAQTALVAIPTLLGDIVINTDATTNNPTTDNTAPEATADVIETATPEIIETPTPDIPPTATFDVDRVAVEARTLQFNLDQMNIPIRGLNTLLVQYWSDVSATGSTGACLNPAPVLPPDYLIPDDVAAAAPADFLAAVENYNLGMQLSRQSWDALMAGCSAGNLGDLLATSQVAATTAQSAFDDAVTNLNNLELGN